MKYEVSFYASCDVTATVEADSEEEAEDLAVSEFLNTNCDIENFDAEDVSIIPVD